MKFLIAALIGMAVGAAFGAVDRRGDTVVVSGDGCAVTFSAANGSILSVTREGQAGPILQSGESGLWHVRFQDGSSVSAADFSADSEQRRFACETDEAANAVRMVYRSPQIAVTVTVTGRSDGVEFVGEVEPREKTILDFAVPARIRFDPDRLERLVAPENGNFSVGTAYNARFFKQQPQDKPSGWQSHSTGPAGYVSLYGGPLDQREDNEPTVTLQVTEDGRQWLGAALADRIDGAQFLVNRPSAREQAPLTLVDSPNGPYFSANGLGGRGRIWRLGGRVGEAEENLAAGMVSAVIERLAAPATPGRTKAGLLSLKRGPEAGGWASVKVAEWLKRLRALPAARSGEADVVELATPREMMEALAADDFVAILNPYGEGTPVLEEGGMPAAVEAIGRYVRAGGNWFEVGGYPFHYELRPLRHLSRGTPYPAGFADFLHLDTNAGSASIYRAQPRPWAPWAGATDKRAIFVPGRLAWGGDEQGGYCDRSFGTFVARGETWRAPAVRLIVGRSAAESLRAYCEANGIERRLEDKMSPEVLAKLKQAVLVYYSGGAKEKLDHLERLPVPTLIHFADYLKGGFDKQYPDHLPPRADFGTPEEFRAFFDRAHELGHLVMPYTNPTWWCDGPKGPTFEREGEAPLLRRLDGELSHERYATNEGFTICFWHPAVQAANRKTVRQFTEEYPVHVLFQDQCGARSWRYDTNSASPTPYAYTEGLISMVQEDSQTKPLSTEGGWDGVVNWQAQLCGMSWGTVPTEGGPSWRRLMKHDVPPETWEVFPLAQYIAHDRCAMLYHDLGQFVTNREVLVWTLGLGFSLSYRTAAMSLGKHGPREWLKWLDRLQKSICARYVGEPVRGFEHDRGPEPTVEDDGVMRATYGPVEIVANLGPRPRTEAGRELPGHGFCARAPGVVAANLKTVAGADFGEEGLSFVTEGDARRAEVWAYAAAGQGIAVELPADMRGEVTVAVDGAPAATAAVQDRCIRFALPGRSERKRVAPPPELADRAPRDRPGPRPAIGILDLGEGIALSWTSIMPQDWLTAFEQSRLAREFRVPVRSIASAEELFEALKAGPQAWLAIINPYGEVFPCAAPGGWQEALEAIRDYVNRGGCWWETGGYSLYSARWPGDDGWEGEAIGPRGMAHLGLPVGGGDVDQPPEPLRATDEGREWLGPDLSGRIDRTMSAVNRGLSRGGSDPGHLTLVAGERDDFIGGYRLDGWGWLWRIGGFHPDPDVALPVAVGAMEHIYTHPPLPAPRARGPKYLWHAVVTAR